jgi:hypothetical protein
METYVNLVKFAHFGDGGVEGSWKMFVRFRVVNVCIKNGYSTSGEEREFLANPGLWMSVLGAGILRLIDYLVIARL